MTGDWELVQDEPRGFVSFVDERKKMRYASKTRPRERNQEPKPPAKKARFKGRLHAFYCMQSPSSCLDQLAFSTRRSAMHHAALALGMGE